MTEEMRKCQKDEAHQMKLNSQGNYFCVECHREGNREWMRAYRKKARAKKWKELAKPW